MHTAMKQHLAGIVNWLDGWKKKHYYISYCQTNSCFTQPLGIFPQALVESTAAPAGFTLSLPPPAGPSVLELIAGEAAEAAGSAGDAFATGSLGIPIAV